MAQPQPADVRPWYQRVYRWGQTNLTEIDPSRYLMLRGSATQFAERAPWLSIAPGVAISLAVFAFNFVGDALRDALDPRLRTL